MNEEIMYLSVYHVTFSSAVGLSDGLRIRKLSFLGMRGSNGIQE